MYIIGKSKNRPKGKKENAMDENVKLKVITEVGARYDADARKVVLTATLEEDDSIIEVGETELKGAPEDFEPSDYEDEAIECAHYQDYGFEDEEVCTWCGEIFNRYSMREEVDLGWLCDRCVCAIKSRGERLAFYE